MRRREDREEYLRGSDEIIGRRQIGNKEEKEASRKPRRRKIRRKRRIKTKKNNVITEHTRQMVMREE